MTTIVLGVDAIDFLELLERTEREQMLSRTQENDAAVDTSRAVVPTA